MATRFFQVGVVYDPSRDECFTAIKGRGAFLNGERIGGCDVGGGDGPANHRSGDMLELPSKPPPPPLPLPPPMVLKDAVVCVGSPPLPSAFHINLCVIAELGPKCRGLRILSSAALIFCWVSKVACLFPPYHATLSPVVSMAHFCSRFPRSDFAPLMVPASFYFTSRVSNCGCTPP